MNPTTSPNFAYLAEHDTRLVALGTQAEAQFATDPTVTLFKLRQFAEVLAQRAAARLGFYVADMNQAQLIDRLSTGGVIGLLQRELFHDLRQAGNAAVHDGVGSHSEALHQIKTARQLGIWFHRSFGSNRSFDPGPFVPPPAPETADSTLREQLAALRQDVAKRAKEVELAQLEAARAKQQADAELSVRLTAEQLAAKALEDAAIWQALADEQFDSHAERTKAQLEAATELAEQNRALRAELESLQAAAKAMPIPEREAVVHKAHVASEAIEIDEAATRKLIDRQLRDAGWEVDTEHVTYRGGNRPTKGKNLAIAEWPTLVDGKKGWADYVLFVGLMVVGVVEAKRKNRDVSASIQQAKRYAQGFVVDGNVGAPVGSPWGSYRVPFLFATNGRAYLRQLATASGIWFLDARRADNHARPMEGWYTPEGLVDLLRQDQDEAHEKLAREPMLASIDRAYQKTAIYAVEAALEAGSRALLVAMATGTGKTRMCIGLCYRLLKTKRFRRILFLVDRSALGEQTANALKDIRMENLQTFADIFDVKYIGDFAPERETKLQIATIQAMVRRIIGPHSTGPEEVPPVDQYDCVIVDECHRGYLLDAELTDAELPFRDEAEYISNYRRVLDHFDAVKIGLTATPALHTTEIFGKPIYSYSYREAVIDGYLVDHEPPIRIVTKLASDGVKFEAHEEVTMFDRVTHEISKELLPDEVTFEVEHFNRSMINVPFTEAVLRELVKHIDPEQGEKTLIFCVNDTHADQVVILLKAALVEQYGAVDDDAVAKITGKADRPLDAIRRFRNERHPNIAVTVDLLTTGIDIPKIANLVFLRRVRSRILYEQMIGRATRLCDEIGKERFRIFDAVEVYAALRDLSDMKPVVVKPFITFEQLARELTSESDEAFRRQVIDELIAKLQRKKATMKGELADAFQAASGMDVKELLRFLKSSSVDEAAAYLQRHLELPTWLDRTTQPGTGTYKMIVSEKPDEIREVVHGYGKHGSRPPGDYLESFRAFLTNNLNKLPALLVVTQRPRDLTRESLRGLKLLLDQEGFAEKSIQSAWNDQKNEDIAATIVGYIRQLALGSPLLSYSERVDGAMKGLRRRHKFTDPQSKWLDRIAKQIKVETVVDRASFDAGQFQTEGGFARLNKVFDGKLELLLGELAEEVWKDAG